MGRKQRISYVSLDAMDAPMQWTKQVASHFGGTRNGMAISWPARIKDKGGLRSQFCHVIDIVPTIYEAANITPPEMLDGVKPGGKP